MGVLGGYGVAKVAVAGPKNVMAWYGSFETDGTNTPINVRGQGFTVTKHATTGHYLVTLDRAVKEFISISVGVDSSGATDAAYNVSASNTVGSIRAAATVRLLGQSSAGTDANLDGPRINFSIYANLVT
jgi:hypothetical protein